MSSNVCPGRSLTAFSYRLSSQKSRHSFNIVSYDKTNPEPSGVDKRPPRFRDDKDVRESTIPERPGKRDPPRPCRNCGGSHWDRACPKTSKARVHLAEEDTGEDDDTKMGESEEEDDHQDMQDWCASESKGSEN